MGEFVLYFAFTSLLLFFSTLVTRPHAAVRHHSAPQHHPAASPPSYPAVTFAYLISASKGDVGRLKRALRALYHPNNCYLLHLDLEAVVLLRWASLSDRRQRLREVPGEALHRAGGVPLAGVAGGAGGRLLPGVLAALDLPLRHVRPHRPRLLLHHLRLRRDQQGRRGGDLRPGVQGVPPRGLLQLAAEAGQQRQELGQDQELPPGRQGLQEHAANEGNP